MLGPLNVPRRIIRIRRGSGAASEMWGATLSEMRVWNKSLGSHTALSSSFSHRLVSTGW